MRTPRSLVAVLAGIAVACTDRSLAPDPLELVGPAAAITYGFPGEDPGPPYYAVLEAQFVAHTDEWAAVPFVRDPACIAAGFNLLVQIAVPQAFGCPLTVAGHVTYKNGPPPIDLAPIHAVLRDAGPVPVWFVAWPELSAAISDGVLTLPELSALPSRRIGSASFFSFNHQPGPERPQGMGNGKIEMVARGLLENGTPFTVQVREMGVDGVSVSRHTAIEFR